MTTHSIGSPPGPRTLLPLIAAIGGALFQVGCHRIDSARADSSTAVTRPTIDARARSLELSTAQLQAIRIEPAQTAEFASESESVGSVSFDEDPAIVQAESTMLTAAAT